MPGRVLLVLHEDTLGGATRAALRPVEVLRERGWEVSAWCADPSPLHDELVARGFAVEGVPRLMRYRLSSLRHPPGVHARLRSLPAGLAAFRRHLTELRPDVVHVNGQLALPEAFVARSSGFGVVTFMHEAALPGVHGVLGRIGPWIGGHRVLAVSQSHAASLRVGRRVPDVVYARVDVPEQPVRRPQAVPVVGTVGWVTPGKGMDRFVDLAEQLRGEPVEFRIAGEVEDSHLREWGELQLDRAARAGVRHLGRVDVPRELEEWDILVAATRGESFGLTVAEAMAAGVAVVGVDVDAVAEQLREGGGVIVPPEGLAAAVRELLADPERRAALGAEGHRIARERFAGDPGPDVLEAAYRAAAQRTRTR